MFRTRAGDLEVLDKVLCKGPHHDPDDAPTDDPTRNDDDDDDDESRVGSESGAGGGLVSKRAEDHHNNAHLLCRPSSDGPLDASASTSNNVPPQGEGGGPSRYVAYYDAASLYPSSGEPASQTVIIYR